MNVLEILNKSKSNVCELLNTSLGVGAESIYKDSVFQGLNEKQKKSARKKVRNYVHSIFETLIDCEKNGQKENIKKLVKEFCEFYKETYRINDYSFASVASSNTKNKDLILKALVIIKANLNQVEKKK